MYKIKHKRPSHFHYDLIIIGTGSGGGIAAHRAVKDKKKVAVVEAGAFGGECPNFGCVPTKALLQAAETFQTINDADEFGIDVKDVHVHYDKIKAWKDEAVAHTGTSEGAASFEEDGIDVVRGHAHFLSPWTISVQGKRLTAKHFLIATGTHDIIPPVKGLKETGFITYREAINLTEPPKRLVVIGGGAIGCEFTQLFSTFEADIHMVEFAPRLFAKEDPEVGELLQAIFEERGIEVHTGSKVVEVNRSGGNKIVTYEKDGRFHKITTDEILLAAGKAANVDLGLENAGVEYTPRGIMTDQYMKTSQNHIYASGDVTGQYMFTHTAAYQSRLAAHNMFHRKKYAADYHAIPRCVFVEPEIACVGATESELQERKIPYQVSAIPISIIGRSNTSKQDTGFVKVLATKKRGVLLGASIISPRAGEMIHELTLAIQKGLTAEDIARTIHAFPTWSEAVRIACNKIKAS